MCGAPREAEPGPARRPIAERLLGTFTWVVALGVVSTRLSVNPSWQADLANLRDIALVGVGPGGGVSTALAQIARLAPLGSGPFRTAAVSTLTLALAARLLFGIALAFLRSVETERSAWLAPTLATIAALTTVLTPTFELQATAGGGSIVAVTLLLAVVSVSMRIFSGATESAARSAILAGALLGATFGEDIACGALGALYLFTAVTIARRAQATKVVVPRRALRAATTLGATLAVALHLPFVVRSLTPHTSLDLGFVGSARLAGLVEVSPSVGVFAVLAREIGWIPLALAGAGALAALAARRTRYELAPLFLFALADGAAPAVLPRRLLAVLSFASWDLAALAVLAIAFVTGVHAAVTRLGRLRLPLAKPASVLFVAMHVTLIAIIAEQAGDRADRGSHTAAAEWTDSALVAAPASSIIVVSTPALALRLLSAELAEGSRPDVVILPLGMLGRGSVAADVAARERSTESLIRTIALTNTADEFALSDLAQHRLVLTELDPRWDKRVIGHLTLAGPLLAFTEHPVGPADRKASFDASGPALARLFGAVAPDAPADPDSAKLVVSLVRSDVTALARAGDVGPAADFAALARSEAGEASLDRTSVEVDMAVAEADLRSSVAPEKRPAKKPRAADRHEPRPKRAGRRSGL